MRSFAQSNISSQAADPDDSSVLLSNTNKLLSAVGISAKTILSTEELTRVASRVVRNPQLKIDYETNAQLVVDSLSDQIQMDLKHITGQSIVNGDIRALSNLVHILVRIVSITSHDNLSSINTSEDSNERDLLGNYRNLFHRRNSIATDSISTHDSIFCEKVANFPIEKVFKRPNSFSNCNDNLLASSLLGIESLKIRNEKLKTAVERRERIISLRESQLRVANLKHTETSRKALQKRWTENNIRHEKSFELRLQNEENVMLRKIYQGLLLKMAQCKREEEKEAREKVLAAREQTSWQIQSLNGLFEERVRQMRSLGNDRRQGHDIRDENLRTSELLQSIISRNDAVLNSMKNRSDQKKEREMLRRRESYQNMLALVAPHGEFNKMSLSEPHLTHTNHLKVNGKKRLI